MRFRSGDWRTRSAPRQERCTACSVQWTGWSWRSGREPSSCWAAPSPRSPTRQDPVADLVAAGLVFREFSRSHPSLFRIAVQRAAVSSDLAAQFRPAAAAAMAELVRRVARLQENDGLGGRSAHEAASQFHALCEGLAALELRGVLDADGAEAFWRSALTALVAGFTVPARRTRRSRRP